MTKFSTEFVSELSLIKSDSIKEFVKYVLDNRVPDYFGTFLSSSSKRFHPLNKNGEPETLIEHSKSVVRMLFALIKHPDINSCFSEDQLDILVASAILHDCVKYGFGDDIIKDHTQFEHPVNFKLICDDTIIEKYQFEFIAVADVISAHHGPWRICDYSDVILPPATDSLKWYLHLADYLASRTYIRVDYDWNEFI